MTFAEIRAWLDKTENRETVFMIAGTIFLAVVFGLRDHAKAEKALNGLSKGKSASDFDPEELALGTETELEHTSDRKVASRIAMDHLTEDPHYYTKLRRAGL